MEIWNRIKGAWNALVSPSISTEEEKLLEWLGISGTKRKLVAEVTYYTCLKMLSETMGKLPLKYYKETEKGKIRADPDEATRLLTVRPNPMTTPTALWSAVEMNCQHYGNAYVWIQSEFKPAKYGGEYKRLGLWLMRSSDVIVLMDNAGIFGGKGELYYQYNDPCDGEMYIFRNDEVMHFKTWYSLNGIMGEPVRNILTDTIGGALESQRFMNKLYEQGLTASMALQYTENLDEERRKKLQNKFGDALTGPKNAGKIIPVPVGLQLTPLKMNLTDAQFFELKKYSALQIAGAFGIKPNQINNYEKSSYANSESQQLAFLVDTMGYRLKAYEEEINYKLLLPNQQKENYFYKFNEKAILRTDSKTQMENLTKAVNNGVYTPNEARGYVDLPAKEGGDILMVNGNYIPVTMVGTQYVKGGEGGEESGN